MRLRPLGLLWLLLVTFAWSAQALAARTVLEADSETKLRSALAAGLPQDVLILLEDDRPPAPYGRQRLQRLGQKKHELLSTLPAKAEPVTDYNHLPVLHLRLRGAAALDALKKHPAVQAIHPDRPLYPQLAQSLGLIRQALPAALGYTGAGTAIAVIDSGVDFTRPDFGSCTAPGVPAGCRVSAMVEIAPEDGSRDSSGHGTNVAAIAAAVAPGTAIIGLDVFDGTFTTESLVLAGIDWVISRQAEFRIAAINLSLGDGLKHTAPCGNHPFAAAVNTARAAGLVVVAASGNNGFTDGINRPACTPGVISVGAVYDADLGGRRWSSCTDDQTSADKMICFSNSADYLSLLAPGALITAGGSTRGGTSMAAPHIAGAVAVLRQKFPGESPDQTLARLQSLATPVIDPRNGRTFARLDLTRSTEADLPSAAPIPGLSGWSALAAISLLGFTLLRRKN